jgi:hypothetical protein
VSSRLFKINSLNYKFNIRITNNVLAMARPQDKLIKNSNLIQQMKMYNIRTIFNLQVKNEHSTCGNGNLKQTGFSYDPNDFISSGSIFINNI